MFGLIVDTSGNLNHARAAVALGAISTYALSRSIPSVRMVLSGMDLVDVGQATCDELFQRFAVSQRANSTIQPAIDLLDTARDFPDDAPILILTAVPCDRIKTNRTHAYLIPEDGRLTYHNGCDGD